MEAEAENVVNPARKKPNLSKNIREGVYQYLLQVSNNGVLKYGSIKNAAIRFSTSTKTVSRIWCRGQNSLQTEGYANVASRKAGRVGRKPKIIDLESVKRVPLKQRSNIRSLSHALNVPIATLHKHIKSGLIKPHSNAIKPFLTDTNKIQRLQYCLSMLDPQSVVLNTPNPIFKDMTNMIHVDEKWFYLTKTSTKFYLAQGEEEPHRTCKSKKFITKVMFLAAVARPRWDHSRNLWFDGKLGIWPFIYKEAAKRRSKNRPVGTLETKIIPSVGKKEYKQMLIQKLLPAIENKWPRSKRSPKIYIQQDNAKPHLNPDDDDFIEAVRDTSFDIKMTCQPPNSPDTNVLDLGFFNSIQALQHQTAPSNIDELIAAVENAFNTVDRQTLNKVFITHQQCLIEIMKVKGGNNYKVPHLGKDRLIRQNQLPLSLPCDKNLIQETENRVIE